MNVLEKEIEDIIHENLIQGNSGILYERGLFEINNYQFYKRQLDLGSYGRADLIGFSYNPYFTGEYEGVSKKIKVGVFEIKKGEINQTTYLQACRYCKGIERYVDEKYPFIDLEFNIILIGTSVDRVSDFCLSIDYIKNLSVYTVSIDLEKGVRFNIQNGFANTNETLSKGDSFIVESLSKKIRTSIREMYSIKLDVENMLFGEEELCQDK